MAAADRQQQTPKMEERALLRRPKAEEAKKPCTAAAEAGARAVLKALPLLRLPLSQWRNPPLPSFQPWPPWNKMPPPLHQHQQQLPTPPLVALHAPDAG